jgi:serine/threonine protein kinase
VLIADDGVGRVTSFGLARLTPGDGHTGMTITFPHGGTAQYLSYELVAGEEAQKPTTASDIWALACIGIEVGVCILHW